MQYNTVIFDMDGLLIDSEPLWAEAANQVFADFGIRLTPGEYATTTGLRTREFVQHWFTRYQLPEDKMSAAGREIEDRVSGLITQKGRPMPGVKEIFDFFHRRSFRIGLASSSPLNLIEQVSRQLGIENYLMAVASAEHLDFGKPHPEVYLNCAALLGSLPGACICFEDSFNGMIAVKSARMKCVVVPSKNEFQRPVWQAADLKISSLQNFNELLLVSL